MTKYRVIYADPPWRYRNKRTGGSLKSGAEQKYPTMSIDEICALPVRDIAARNSVLFLWATVPLLPEALAVMQAWGFTYKTKITWRKIMSLGMGYWYRGQVEDLLVGIRGKVKPFRCQRPNFIQTKALRHSEKPQEVRELIEMSTGGVGPRIELFARKRADGWDAWGNEVDCPDEIAPLPRGERVSEG